MRLRECSEKWQIQTAGRERKTGHKAIVAAQHVLLWSALYVLGSTVWVITAVELAPDVITTAALMLTAAFVSVGAIMLASLIAHAAKQSQPTAKPNTLLSRQGVAALSMRLAVTLWLVADGITITFTMARHPSCSAIKAVSKATIDAGIACTIQRSSIGAGLLALPSSTVLFILMQKVQSPFRSHLFGVKADSPLLPLVLSYKKAMYSEMSFKCRSSTSLSSQTLVPSFGTSTTTLLPTKPERVIGLGIYTPKQSAPTFLAPRPSLSSIRSHATNGPVPPSSPLPPLPPLPAYLRDRYTKSSAMHKAVHPPRRPPRPERTRSERTVRLVPPSPALSAANLGAHNRSVESLSSIYSCSISGERYSLRIDGGAAVLRVGSRSYSSGSTVTAKKSPLGATRLASHPDVVVGAETKDVEEDGSDSDIGDVETLQARLTRVQPVSDFGDVDEWVGGKLEADAFKIKKSSLETRKHVVNRTRPRRTFGGRSAVVGAAF